jgi:glycine/D-amino acid oxidase-like deaminating enzyme
MIAQKRDLRTGLSIWLDKGTRKVAGTNSLTRAKPDVVVVGSGISGALTADALQLAGLSVLVVDRRKKPMAGSTPASTALLQSELDTPLTTLSRKIGKQDAARAWVRSAMAVGALADRVNDLGLASDFIPRNSIYLPGNVLDGRGLLHEHRLRRDVGLRAELLSRADVRRLLGIKVAAAILTRGNAEADPVKLLAGLWRNFLANGGQIVKDFEVAHLDETRSRVELKAADGRRVTSKHAVFCTGYEVLKAFRPKGFKVISTWAIATKPQARKLWKGRELIWEAADPYLYARTTVDGRVVTGGADEDFSDEQERDALISEKSRTIAKQAARYFPKIDFEPDYAWSGSFGESPTGLPAIGRVTGCARSYSVMGFGGNGITFSMLAAQIVSAAIMGYEDPDAGIFRP